MKFCNTDRNGTAIKLYDNAALLPACWDELIPEHHFLKSNQLVINEQMNLPDVQFMYAIVLWNERPIAASYFQVLAIQEHHLNTHALSALQTTAWSLFTKWRHPKLLVAGHLFRHDISSFFCSDEVSAFNAFHLYRRIIEQASAQSKAMATLVKDMPEQLIPYFNRYAAEYLLMPNDIAMEMTLQPNWQSIHDYETSLKHKYAQRFRKVRALKETLDIQLLSVEDTEKNKDVLFQLYQQVSNRQQVRLGLLNADFLPILKRHYQDELNIWIAYEAGKPVGFFSAWSSGAVFDMFYIGIDYERNDALQLYFNILFFSIEQAIAFKKQKLILGRTALEAKARLGCKPKYLSTFLYIKNSFLRKAIGYIQNKVTPNEGEWENRHPFK